MPAARHDKMIGLVDRMLDPSAGSGRALCKQLPKAKTPHGQESLKRQIDTTDKAVDALVYELYGLTDRDVGVVESASCRTAREHAG